MPRVVRALITCPDGPLACGARAAMGAVASARESGVPENESPRSVERGRARGERRAYVVAGESRLLDSGRLERYLQA